MDWIDPRYAEEIKAESEDSSAGSSSKSGKSRRKTLISRTRAALAQPVDVWSAAYDHAISHLSWPKHVSAESTFLWSCVLQEQAECLVRAGMSAKQIAYLANATAAPRAVSLSDQAQRESVSTLMSWPIEAMAAKWLEEADREADSAFGLAAFAWQLPEHGRRPGNTWLGPWLQDAAERVVKCSCDAEDSVLCELVMKCELPLLLGTVTGAGKRTLFAEAFDAMDQLALLLEQSEDQPARWLAYGTTYLRGALASVLRCRVLADALGLRRFFAPQRAALAQLLEHAARWSRPGASSLLGVNGVVDHAQAHWEALFKIARKSKPLTALMTLSDLIDHDINRNEAKKMVTSSELPPLTHYCETARGVCMQTDWKKRSGRIAMDFSDTPIALEVVGPKGISLLSGRWPIHVELDGQAQMQMDDWEEVCWYSDDEVDYLEIEARFGENCTIQRQLVLFREDGLVLLADALLGEKAGNWSLQSHLQLGAGVAVEEAQKTREAWLVSPHGERCMLLPLAQPEWRTQLCNSKLTFAEHGITLRTTTQAAKVYAPLLLSLKNNHSSKPMTWRQLTVAEDLQIVPPSTAVAFRVQIGSDQWLVYRTLEEATRRTTLGMHTIYDFFTGRFDGDSGDVDILVEVESS